VKAEAHSNQIAKVHIIAAQLAEHPHVANFNILRMVANAIERCDVL
jgi:hypothetical protein